MVMFVTVPLKTWHSDIPMLITPRRLLEKVKKDSESNYNWIASATELVKTCNLPNFPSDIADEIEDIILGCFASLAVNGIYTPSYQEETDESAVWKCYMHSRNRELREFYLTEVIRRAIMLAYGDLGPIFFSGPEHDDFERKFIKKQIYELHRAERMAECNEVVNYPSWRKSLQQKYQKAYDEAVKLGKFQSDYAERDKLFSLNTAAGN